MSKLENAIKLTENLLNKINKKLDSTSREETIQQIEEMFEEREQLLLEIKGPFSAEEQIQGKYLLKISNVLNTHLNRIKNEIKIDIQNIKKKKTSTNRYVNPYQDFSNLDGVFYDKKK